MAKTCLNKIAGNFTQMCTISPVGIKNLYLMNVEDTTLTVNTGVTRIETAVFADRAKSYLVEGYKQTIQVTASLRALDASAKLDVSVSFKAPHRFMQTYADRNGLLVGRYFVLVDYVDSASSSVILGYTSPLEVTSFDFDSNSGAGLVTITLGAPEGSAGNYFMSVSDVAKNTIISKSV